ncbi:CsbD family protein [Methylobacterium nonmethylotrophicum]|uniref:CsbD family protein n=1 Tax=Methylobacterium nonmethylotrophicum TaxID=1141884 RepID=A0A4Z0NVN4_9HYPH|nr:CsbD family protein [Methylobacterium nonmethylotrophicum]TGE00732.1 CsbD family protein [Methylobacterium nonmethylotrophicum]
MNRDQIEGGLHNLKGRGQTALGAVSGRARPQAEGALNQVIGGAQYAYGRGRRVAEELSHDGAALAGEIEKRGRHAYARGREVYGEARHRGRKALRRAETHPTETLLAVAGLAFAAGWLLKGRR